MTTPGAVAAAIAAIIDAIDGTGVVYDHQPLPYPTDDVSTFVQTYTTSVDGARVVRAWTVTFVGFGAVSRARAFGNDKVLRDYRFLVRCYYSLGGSSEATFRSAVETVANALDASNDLGATVLEHAPVEVEVPNNGDGYLVGGVVCHTANIGLVCRVEVTL